jgi:hypothetical protein
MWAGGAGVTRGYVNLPEVTATRWKYNPFAADGYVTRRRRLAEFFLTSSQVYDVQYRRRWVLAPEWIIANSRES